MTKNFTPGANTFAPGGVPTPSTFVPDVQVLSDSGAITLLSGIVNVTKAGVAALTLAVPDQDGQLLWITDETGNAHTITLASGSFNGDGSTTVLTMSGTKGDSIQLISRGGTWFVVHTSGTIKTNAVLVVAAPASAAITIQTSDVFITKSSAAATMTLAAPTATTHDGFRIRVISTTAQAHTITLGSGNWNADGSHTVATFGGAKGDNIEIEAYQGTWYIVDKTNITLS